MKVSILTIGDEICIGQVLNTNAAWISSELTKLGCDILFHSIVGDSGNIIKTETERLLSNSDLVITTGGLGPTHDDITKEVICEFFGDTLVLDEQVLNHIIELFATRGFTMLERNKMQALVPSRCKVLNNELGTAPGMLFEKDGKFLISLPGVPQEMMNITENHVIPFVKELIATQDSEIVLYKNMMFSGISESYLAEILGEPAAFLGDSGSLAFLPSYKGLKLRVGVRAPDFDKANIKINEIIKHIRENAGKYIYSFEDLKITEAIGELLRITKKTVAVAESCTGGLLAAEFTDVPGSSDYFWGGIIAYNNALKINRLGVNPETINRFGAVSQETATEMACGIRKLLKVDYGIAITGIAGPTGGTDVKPVGTVWIAIASENSVEAKKYNFSRDRHVNRERAVGTALHLLWNIIRNLD